MAADELSARRVATLAHRLRRAAVAIEDLATLAGYPHPSWPVWNPISLRREADVLEGPDHG
jgi:hypothetical protein